MGDGAVVVVGGTRGIGLELVRHYAGAGREVVLHGRSDTVADAVAEAGGKTRGLTFDLADPHSIRPALADVGPVDRLALVAIDRDQNTIADYDIDKAMHLVTLKLVGYATVVAALRDRLSDSSSIVLFGGMAKERPYPGSTTVTTVNGGVVGLTRIGLNSSTSVRVNPTTPPFTVVTVVDPGYGRSLAIPPNSRIDDDVGSRRSSSVWTTVVKPTSFSVTRWSARAMS